MALKPWTVKIVADYLLVVEGPDDKRFFEALLNRSGIPGFQVVRVDGIGNLQGRLRALKTDDDFVRVASMGVVCDADDNRDGAFRNICRALRAANLPIPQEPLTMVGDRPRVSVMIMPPDKVGTGRMLEDLCLEAVTDDPAMHCVDEYFRCLEDQNVVQKGGARPKARLHAFLASRERPGLRLGEAADKNEIPLDSPVFEPVAKFLRQLAS